MIVPSDDIAREKNQPTSFRSRVDILVSPFRYANFSMWGSQNREKWKENKNIEENIKMDSFRYVNTRDKIERIYFG